MRIHVFSIYENKGSYHASDQYLCFRYIDILDLCTLFTIGTVPLAFFYGSTTQFVSDLVGNPKDKFSYDTAKLEHAGLMAEESLIRIWTEWQTEQLLQRSLYFFLVPKS